MQFQSFEIPGGPDYLPYMEKVKQHWSALGWEEIPKADEAGIIAVWSANLHQGTDVIIPEPSRTWRGKRLARYRQQPELEAEFTLKMLDALRQCTRPEERLLALDPQHAWYYFNPHGNITAPTRDEWAMPILPDGDFHNYFAPDFRFGIVTGWRETGPVTMFGEELIAAFDTNPPEQFLQACGPGYLRRRRTKRGADNG